MVGASPTGAGVHAVVGREVERSRVDDFVERLPDGPSGFLVCGEPGIGKTNLWRYALDRCRGAGFRILVTRPAEEEMPVAFVGLTDLFDDIGTDVGLDLDGGAVHEGDRFGPGRASLSALRRLLEDGPVVIAIDDLQWLDSGSARALRFALRRLHDQPVAVLATARSSDQGSDPLDQGHTLGADRTQSIELEPLDVDDLRKVLAAAVPSISRPVLTRIHGISGGNPFYAIQIARALRARGRAQRTPEDLPLPDSVQRAIAERLDVVPAQLVPLLQVVSAAGPSSVASLRPAVDGDLDRLLDAAARQGLLVVGRDLEVRFSHPLLASAVSSRMGALARRDLHARLAEHAGDADARARHLALSALEPDGPVAALMEAASARAAGRGAFDVAAEFDRHAVRLTPAAEGEASARRALDEVVHLAAAGEAKRALALADSLIVTMPPGPARTEVIVQRVYLDLDAAASVLTRSLEETRDELLRGRLLDLLGWLRGIIHGDLPGGMACAREAAEIGERTGDLELQMLAGSSVAVIDAMAGHPQPARMAQALALAEGIGGPPLARRPQIFFGRQLMWAGDLAGARTSFERAFDDFVSGGTEFQRPYRLCDLSLVACAAGDFAAADGFVAQGIEAALDAENTDAVQWLLYPKALVEAWLGRAADARSTAAELEAGARARGERLGLVRARSVLGLLALSEGDFERAARDLTRAAGLLEEMGIEHPGVFRVLPDAVEALARSGDHGGAHALLERLERQADAIGGDWSTGARERSTAMVLLARGKADEAAELFGGATERFDRSGHRPDAARAVLGRGRALLRGGHRNLAADALADARARFAVMGARRWEHVATTELERASAGRAAGELTTTERRVAKLVADGMKNRQIGHALFVSVGTVEAHLTRIYRKLEIGSRSELTRLVVDGRIDLAGADLDDPNGVPRHR